MRRSSCGVTLIELLVALALLGIVLDLGFLILRDGQKMLQKQQVQAVDFQSSFLRQAQTRNNRLDSCLGKPLDQCMK